MKPNNFSNRKRKRLLAFSKGDERTVQYDGIADEPKGKELDSLKELYFTDSWTDASGKTGKA